MNTTNVVRMLLAAFIAVVGAMWGSSSYQRPTASRGLEIHQEPVDQRRQFNISDEVLSLLPLMEEAVINRTFAEQSTDEIAAIELLFSNELQSACTFFSEDRFTPHLRAFATLHLDALAKTVTRISREVAGILSGAHPSRAATGAALWRLASAQLFTLSFVLPNFYEMINDEKAQLIALCTAQTEYWKVGHGEGLCGVIDWSNESKTVGLSGSEIQQFVRETMVSPHSVLRHRLALLEEMQLLTSSSHWLRPHWVTGFILQPNLHVDDAVSVLSRERKSATSASNVKYQQLLQLLTLYVVTHFDLTDKRMHYMSALYGVPSEKTARALHDIAVRSLPGLLNTIGDCKHLRNLVPDETQAFWSNVFDSSFAPPPIMSPNDAEMVLQTLVHLVPVDALEGYNAYIHRCRSV